MLELPDLPPKGDIVDWQRAGGTAAELTRLIAAIGSNGNHYAEAETPFWYKNEDSSTGTYANGHDARLFNTTE